MRYTIKDVAARAGVSVGTVSRVVNGDPRVLDTNRARVREAIEALGYRPNAVAQTLVAGGAPRRAAPPPEGAPRLAVVGTVSVDHFAMLPAWPERGSRLSADRFERCIGGPAANVAIAAARLGGPYRLAVDLVSSLGDDADSDWALGELIGCGVSVAPVLRRLGHRLARSIVLVERQGLRTIIGESVTLPPTDVAARLDAMLAGERPLCLHLEGYRVGLFEALPEWLWGALGLRSLDSTGLPPVWHHWPNFLRLCAAFDVIFLSRTTARTLLALDVEDQLLAEMLAARLGGLGAARARIVVTLGAGGSSMIDGDAVVHAPALPVRPVDTTGAGDVFVGLFLAVLLTGHPPAEALRVAARGASLAVTALGVNTVPITVEALAAAAP